jgi:hypothetical protein
MNPKEKSGPRDYQKDRPEQAGKRYSRQYLNTLLPKGLFATCFIIFGIVPGYKYQRQLQLLEPISNVGSF